MIESMLRTITILIVDDHALFRESVARLLAAEPGFEVVTPCGSVEEAVQALRQVHVVGFAERRRKGPSSGGERNGGQPAIAKAIRTLLDRHRDSRGTEGIPSRQRRRAGLP